MASANAQVLIISDVKYFLINYDEIVIRIRNGVITPVNGYCVVDKVTEKTRRKGLLLSVGDFHNKRMGTVRYVGTPNAYYVDSDAVDADVEVGDKVIFEGGFWTALESSLFNELDEDLGFVSRMWINGVL
jgi:co-chaperonin GroES (HSP10)